MDCAATTPTDPLVLEEMLPYFNEKFGNASSATRLGSAGKQAIRTAREQAAALIGALPEEIFFTSGGTESDNWALRLGVRAGKSGRHIIVSAVEHPAVLRTAEDLAREGYRLTVLPVDAEGTVLPETLRSAMCEDTVLVSVMTANNEVGTIEPIRELAQIAHEGGALFHTDAVQAFGQIPLSVGELGADLLSASAHKIFGPKGTGLLYVKKGVRLDAFLTGGGQERGRRSGTENVPGIVGFGKACALAAQRMEEAIRVKRSLRELFWEHLLTENPHVLVSGSRENRLPGNVHICLPGIEGETLLILLDQKGICASSGSACSAGALEPSHVLTAMGRKAIEAKGSLRLTFRSTIRQRKCWRYAS
jgi:cysteine desulfurase